MSETPIRERTEKWYQEYTARKGRERNDILANPGVLFQKLATLKSIVEALRRMSARRDWKVLDVGCGDGNSLEQFLAFGFDAKKLNGIDVMPDAITDAKDRFPAISWTCGDASKMDYAAESFDLVMESTMFIQLTDEKLSEAIAQEMLRVTKTSGYLMLVDWRYSYMHREYRALSRKRIETLFQVGTRTRLLYSRHGALVPPVGRFLSMYFPSLYFLFQRLLPFGVGQLTTVLMKEGK